MKRLEARSTPLGIPGGPCHIIRNIEEERLPDSVKEELVEAIERGQPLDRADESLLYDPKRIPVRVDLLRSLTLSGHAQFRMDLRGITVPEVKRALEEFERWYNHRTATGRIDAEAERILHDMALGRPVKFEARKTGLTIVFTVRRGEGILVSTWWTGEPNPPRPRPGECDFIPYLDTPRGRPDRPRILGATTMDRTARQELVRLVVASAEYPPEVFAKELAALASDVYQAASAGNTATYMMKRHLSFIERVIKFVPMKSTQRRILEAMFKRGWERGRIVKPKTPQLNLKPGDKAEFEGQTVEYLGPRSKGYSRVLMHYNPTSKLPISMPDYNVDAIFKGKPVPDVSRSGDRTKKVKQVLEVLTDLYEQYKRDYEKLTERLFVYKVDGFTVNNKGGFPENKVEAVLSVVKKGASTLRQHGLGEIIYGDINIVGNISSSRHLAWYFRTKDYLEIRADMKSNLESVKTFLHELGHRYWFRAASNKQRHAFTQYYKDLKSNLRHTSRLPQRGDKVQINPRQVIEYSGGSVDRPGKHVVIVHQRNKSFDSLLTTERLKKFFAATDLGGFVSPYASTNEEENFAEMFAFWLMGDLNPEQKEAFESMLERGEGPDPYYELGHGYLEPVKA